MPGAPPRPALARERNSVLMPSRTRKRNSLAGRETGTRIYISGCGGARRTEPPAAASSLHQGIFPLMGSDPAPYRTVRMWAQAMNRAELIQKVCDAGWACRKPTGPDFRSKVYC